MDFSKFKARVIPITDEKLKLTTHPGASKALRQVFGFVLEPFQDRLLVLFDPLHVGLGPLDGLIQGQSPRTKAHLSVVLLKLLQLSTQAGHKLQSKASKACRSKTDQGPRLTLAPPLSAWFLPAAAQTQRKSAL